jgi:hypothetical protein
LSLPREAKKAKRLSLLIGPDARRLFAGLALVAVVLFGQQVYGIASANDRLDPSLRNVSGPTNVVVVLNFPPERFHNERISEYGAFAGRDGALSRLRLRFVSPANLRRLASIAWIAHIEPLKQ